VRQGRHRRVHVIIAEELGRYGVRANAIARGANGMTESTPVCRPRRRTTDASVFDLDPPTFAAVATLAMRTATSRSVFFVQVTVRKFQTGR